MNIYFACSITGGRELEGFYRQFVVALEAQGHIIPTSHLARSEALEGERVLTPLDVYERDVKWIRECDALIAEVSVPSHGVGYEIGYALTMKKPTLCLYQEGRKVSKMITGNPDPALRVEVYSTFEEALRRAEYFLRRS
ncbi:MAG: nucleoside 2-deoxyribosyltransferase [Anaerolineales bacterium]|nr:nucleoside 2-deoxyribosyltransferase [Anaerolineales bacterium]